MTHVHFIRGDDHRFLVSMDDKKMNMDDSRDRIAA